MWKVPASVRAQISLEIGPQSSVSGKRRCRTQGALEGVHWRDLCSLQRVELHPNANCLFFMLYITGAHKWVKHKTSPRESEGQLSLLSRCPENYVMSRLPVSSYMLKFSSLMWSTSETQQVLALTCRELEWTWFHSVQLWCWMDKESGTWQQFYTLRSRLSKWQRQLPGSLKRLYLPWAITSSMFFPFSSLMTCK